MEKHFGHDQAQQRGPRYLRCFFVNLSKHTVLSSETSSSSPRHSEHIPKDASKVRNQRSVNQIQKRLPQKGADFEILPLTVDPVETCCLCRSMAFSRKISFEKKFDVAEDRSLSWVRIKPPRGSSTDQSIGTAIVWHAFESISSCASD